MTSSFFAGDTSNGGPRGREALTTVRPDALPPGTRLDEYEIGPLLSESPLGLVYLATDHSLGRKVAIREYLPSALSGRGEGPLVALRSAGMAEGYRRGLRAFVEEARLLARFDDPSLLRVLRFWEAHFTAYIVMPFYDAPSLAVARERLPMPPAEPWIVSLLESLAQALDLLHGESCLHRNVTPERVLMLRDGRPMLLGPSAVRQVLGRAAHTSLIQPGFSAIEEYAESSDLPQGPWTDVYALGALARFCILGIAPVAAPVRSVRDPLVGMRDALDPLRMQWPELDYSEGLLETIDRALSVDPAQRPQSMGEFRDLLRAAQAVPSRTPRPVAPPRPEPIIDPTRPEPDLHLLSATDLETNDFQANLSAMVDEALVGAPPLRHGREPAPVPMSMRSEPEPEPDVDLPIDPSFADHATAGPGPFIPAGRPTWQRWLTGAMAIVLLGAFGYVGWTQYSRMQEDDRIAARTAALTTPPPTAAAAPASTDPIAEAHTHPPAAGPAPEPVATSTPAADSSTPPASAATPAAPATEEPAPATGGTTAVEAPASTPAEAAAPARTAPEPDEPARTARRARTAAHEARAERALPAPRTVCAGRSNFGLEYCLQTTCEKPQYAGNEQCRMLKLQDR